MIQIIRNVLSFFDFSYFFNFYQYQIPDLTDAHNRETITFKKEIEYLEIDLKEEESDEIYTDNKELKLNKRNCEKYTAIESYKKKNPTKVSHVKKKPSSKQKTGYQKSILKPTGNCIYLKFKDNCEEWEDIMMNRKLARRNSKRFVIGDGDGEEEHVAQPLPDVTISECLDENNTNNNWIKEEGSRLQVRRTTLT